MYQEIVLGTKHFTDNLFSFCITRPKSFRFRSGEFVMLGLEQENSKPLLRAYSVASPNWEDNLEFFSIKVPDGPLTSRLQKINPGDKIIMNRKTTGTLVLEALKPGKTLYLLSTGTGIAPFASIIRDPLTYEMYERVVLTQTCRTKPELEYGNQLVKKIKNDEFLSQIAAPNLIHFTSLTREKHPFIGRITDLIENGTLFNAINMSSWNPAFDRVMICGSTDMTQSVKKICEAKNFMEGSNSNPGDFVIEKAFVG